MVYDGVERDIVRDFIGSLNVQRNQHMRFNPEYYGVGYSDVSLYTVWISYYDVWWLHSREYEGLRHEEFGSDDLDYAISLAWFWFKAQFGDLYEEQQ
jgi:hypothetical protein